MLGYLSHMALVIAVSYSYLGFKASAMDSSEIMTKSAADATKQNRTSKPADSALARDIRKELLIKPLSIQAKNIVITVEKGVVTLDGEVASQTEKNAIDQAARKYSEAVRNLLIVGNVN